MTTIRNICVHHSGGTQSNPLASTARQTVAEINAYHKAEWNFLSELNYYVGYNFVYDPKVRGLTQTRKIGEQTAAVKGRNFDTISICIIGNYSRLPLTNPSRSVDELKSDTIEDIVRFLLDLLDGNKREWAKTKDCVLQLSPFRIKPHRFYSPTTECYGSFIPDDFFMKQVIQKKYGLMGSVVSLLAWLNSFQEPILGAVGDDRECCGHL